MCGIAGVIKYGQKPITEAMIRLFLTGLEHRGNDATGIALQKDSGQLFLIKNDLTPWQFVKSQLYKDFIDEHLTADVKQVILHTRAASKGNPRKHENNHPMFAGKAAVIHNGVIKNDGELFNELKLERKAETDSDILRAIADKHGITKAAIKDLNKIRGGVATAMLHPEYPGWMLLARSGNPLTLAATEDFFAFASEKNVLHRAMRPIVYLHKQFFQVQALDLSFSPFPDHTAYLIGPEGLEWHEEFKSHQGTYTEPIRRVYQDYADRQRKWTNDAHTGQANPEKPAENKTMSMGKLVTNCPKCNRRLAITQAQLSVPRHTLICDKNNGGCGARLAEPPADQKQNSPGVSVTVH